MEMSGAMTVLGIVMMGAMLAVIAWAAVAAVRGGKGRNRGGPGARAVLDERFAAGEIDEDEYERRRQTLERPAD